MKLKHFVAVLTAIIGCMLGACTSDDENLDKAALAEGQPASITVPANQNSEQIRFTATAAWSARTSADSNGADGVEWIHLDDTHGAAGEAYLNFSLDYNNTGKSRTAYIIIVCEDTRIVVTVTQTSEDDSGTSPNSGGEVEVEVKTYVGESGQRYTFDGTTHYVITYSNGLPVSMVSKWRDDLNSYPGAPADHDSYCQNVEIINFIWNGDNRSDVDNVKVDAQTSATYYPSEREDIEDQSEHFAEIREGRAVAGWYWWPLEDLNKSEWDASYDANGYLISSRNNDASSIWETHTMTWKDGDLTKIVSDGEYGRYITITYADSSLLNLHQEFDINWILPKELECYDFAAGDISKIFASMGFMGMSSKHLITEITEYDEDNTTSSYRMDYKENTKYKTVVTVTHFVNDVQTSYSEWTITYNNIH